MTLKIIFFALILVLGCTSEELSSNFLHAPRLFNEFKKEFMRNYKSLTEENRRFQIFAENMKMADTLNQANPYANFGVNMFADWTTEEFKAKYYNGERHFSQPVKKGLGRTIDVASDDGLSTCDSVDWRKKGAVTSVKDQGDCGSCWAFSAVGNIEGQLALAGHPIIDLSPQELVSCDTTDFGCDGGLMDSTFRYLLTERHGEIVTERALKYVSGNTSHNGTCPADLDTMEVGAVITNYTKLPTDEGKWGSFVCEGGPLAITLDASSFQYYKGGVITYCREDSLNHAVLIVGFNSTNGTNPPYWIIKNSWTAGWGEDGYVRIAKGFGTCFIGQYGVTSIVSKKLVPKPHPHPPKI